VSMGLLSSYTAQHLGETRSPCSCFFVVGLWPGYQSSHPLPARIGHPISEAAAVFAEVINTDPLFAADS